MDSPDDNPTEQVPTKGPDWERIETAYRAGVLSTREIAAMNGVTEGAIRKRAKRQEWVRDLQAKIQARASRLVAASAVPAAQRRSEAKIVDANAITSAGVRIAQRQDVSRVRGILQRILTDLEAEIPNDEPTLAELVAQAEPDEAGGTKYTRAALLTGLQRATAMPARVTNLRTVAETLKTIVALEREVYGLAPPPPENAPEDLKPAAVYTLSDEQLHAIAAASRK